MRLLVGDALEQLRTLETGSVQLVVTSPPYFALRSYLPADHPDKHREMGAEPTPAAFIASLVAVFREARRVIRDDGLLFVNLGDSYAGSGKGPTGENGIGNQERRQGFVNAPRQRGDAARPKNEAGESILGANSLRGWTGIRPKSLLLIPERFAIAMQDDGWIVRSQIVWAKKAPMPESVRDRPTSAWEPIWMFAKQGRYFWDAEAVRQPLQQPDVKVPQGFGGHKRNGGSTYSGNPYDASQMGGANLRNVWHLGPEPTKADHYAAYPTEIPKRCIVAGTSERGCCPECGAPWVRQVVKAEDSEHAKTLPGYRPSWMKTYETARSDADIHHARPISAVFAGAVKTRKETAGWAPACQCPPSEPVPCTVLDPFSGSGTTALVADRLGRDAIGIDLNPEYVRMAQERITGDSPLWADVEVSA